MKLVVGLGNPGRKYGRTRHNLGFMVVDRIAAKNGVAIKRKVGDTLVGEWLSAEESVLLAKPQTYMNRSGDAVKTLLEEFLIWICRSAVFEFGHKEARAAIAGYSR